MQHIEGFLGAAISVAGTIDRSTIAHLARELATVRKREGRVFVLGVGGNAATASHAVNDLRKLCGIEAYAPTDNAAELTARTNDEGWDTVFAAWLKTSRIGRPDAVLVLSVGGGDAAKNISRNIVKAVDYAHKMGARVLGIVGRKEGHTAKNGHAVVVIPTIEPHWVTPLSESFAMVVLHCLVSHPDLQKEKTKW